jgi:hypothetical protein
MQPRQTARLFAVPPEQMTSAQRKKHLNFLGDILKRYVDAGRKPQLIETELPIRLMQFTSAYNKLNPVDREVVTDLIIKSIPKYALEDLVCIVGYSSSAMMSGGIEQEKFPIRAAIAIAEEINKLGTTTKFHCWQKDKIAIEKEENLERKSRLLALL